MNTSTTTTGIAASGTGAAASDSATVTRARGVERLITGQATSDGAGVKLTRVLTQDLQRRLDPFLMLDAFGSDDPDDYIAGFPDHPHRGFETVTYMIAGRMLHRDSAGHEGLLENGGVQWMTAGRGVIHSEIPRQEHGVMEGFQLWLNLPGRDKMNPPWYRDFKNADLPQFVSPASPLAPQLPDLAEQQDQGQAIGAPDIGAVASLGQKLTHRSRSRSSRAQALSPSRSRIRLRSRVRVAAKAYIHRPKVMVSMAKRILPSICDRPERWCRAAH